MFAVQQPEATLNICKNQNSRKKQFWAACSYQQAVMQALGKQLQQLKDDNWLLPVMATVCLDLRLTAIKADHNKPPHCLEKAAEALMTCFRICAADNRASDRNTKKWGMLALVNQLFKVYFRINKLHLMKPLIRAIESSPLKHRYLISQQITYRYYVGRKALFDSDYTSANEYLSFAFERCHRMSKKNKRLILIYLVPVKILLGYMPTKAVLEKYELLQLWEVVEAVKCGRVRQLVQAMQNHQAFFIKCGIFLILEKLKIITYRNLFKKVSLARKTTVINMLDLLAALRIMEGPDIDLEEAHCILANLIYEGKVKGYISYAHQKVVLSKTDPFPKLSTLA
ncbi:PCI domain-containing protein 2 [Nilaparvata lugens]|uniref:PCI domain-containing protein 2 n=1 Tax=Nilaparvata lugens TaxID=108931 RepID=UPI00193C9410|nr:PCI domain-containing protein 2 [Nilaparvata lugens]